MDKEEANNKVKTTELSLKIVKVLKEMDKARIEELSDVVDVAPSTIHRHLQTLRDQQYVIREGGFYRLGLQFLTIGGHIRNQRGAYEFVKRSVDQLSKQTGERVQFEVEEMGERVFLYKRAGESAVEANSAIGRRGPLHCSSAGKAILASFPDAKIVEIIEKTGLEPITENTITNREELFEEIEQIRESGVAFNFQESTQGLRAVGAPVKMPNGEVLGAISVSGPAHRMRGDIFDKEIPNKIRGTAQELELNIKYSKNV